MSNDPKSTESTVAAVPTDSPEEKRPNVLVRAARKIKSTPPRTAIAVGAGVALVGVGAFLGRRTAPLSIEIVEADFEPEPLVTTSDEDDTTVA
jgi:hypothetical protein